MEKTRMYLLGLIGKLQKEVIFVRKITKGWFTKNLKNEALKYF
jgi:hypothetical protein